MKLSWQHSKLWSKALTSSKMTAFRYIAARAWLSDVLVPFDFKHRKAGALRNGTVCRLSVASAAAMK